MMFTMKAARKRLAVAANFVLEVANYNCIVYCIVKMLSFRLKNTHGSVLVATLTVLPIANGKY